MSESWHSFSIIGSNLVSNIMVCCRSLAIITTACRNYLKTLYFLTFTLHFLKLKFIPNNILLFSLRVKLQ